MLIIERGCIVAAAVMVPDQIWAALFSYSGPLNSNRVVHTNSSLTSMTYLTHTKVFFGSQSGSAAKAAYNKASM